MTRRCAMVLTQAVLSTALCVLSSVPAMAGCCIGSAGNADCDPTEQVTMNDLTFMIDHLFITLSPLCCEAEGDVDGLPGVTMGDLTVLVDHMFVTMSPLPSCRETAEPTGSMTGHGTCKSFGARESATSDVTGVYWTYTSTDSTLLLRHTDAAFNCCPIIGANVTVQGSVIHIEEIEVEGQCNCMCLFDLDFVINHLPPGTYRIYVTESISFPGEQPLDQTVDLSFNPTGFFFVDRNHYPWQ
jgi:hypothetical protein